MKEAIAVVDKMILDVEKRIYNVKTNDRYRGKANKLKQLETLQRAYIDVYWKLVAEDDSNDGI